MSTINRFCRTLVPRAATLLFFLFVAAPREGAAHVAIDRQIAELTRRITEDPGNATLYLQRGELHRVHREWRAAVSDYQTAKRLAPDLAAVDLCLGQMFHEADMPLRAFEALDRFLAKEPDHPRGRVLRARALVKLGKRREAVGEFTRAIDQTPAGGLPEPEYYLERAQALGAEGGEYAKEALGGLDEGLARLGPVVTLQLCAIDLEMARNRYDAALERLEKLAAQSARKESYLARRGEILEKAGKLGEARQANVKALEALESLPPHKRKTRAMERLRGRLAQAIERLGRGHGVGQVKETKGTEIH